VLQWEHGAHFSGKDRTVYMINEKPLVLAPEPRIQMMLGCTNIIRSPSRLLRGLVSTTPQRLLRSPTLLPNGVPIKLMPRRNSDRQMIRLEDLLENTPEPPALTCCTSMDHLSQHCLSRITPAIYHQEYLQNGALRADHSNVGQDSSCHLPGRETTDKYVLWKCGQHQPAMER